MAHLGSPLLVDQYLGEWFEEGDVLGGMYADKTNGRLSFSLSWEDIDSLSC